MPFTLPLHPFLSLKTILASSTSIHQFIYCLQFFTFLTAQFWKSWKIHAIYRLLFFILLFCISYLFLHLFYFFAQSMFVSHISLSACVYTESDVRFLALCIWHKSALFYIANTNSELVSEMSWTWKTALKYKKM